MTDLRDEVKEALDRLRDDLSGFGDDTLQDLSILRAECEKVAGLEAQLAHRGEVLCSWCGRIEKKAETQEATQEMMLAHIVECPKRPEAQLLDMIATLEAQLEQARAGWGHAQNCYCHPTECVRRDVRHCDCFCHLKEFIDMEPHSHPYRDPRCCAATGGYCQPDPEALKRALARAREVANNLPAYLMGVPRDVVRDELLDLIGSIGVPVRPTSAEVEEASKEAYDALFSATEPQPRGTVLAAKEAIDRLAALARKEKP